MTSLLTDTCRCGDLLRSGEVLCEFCTSQAEAEARWAEADDALGDLLAESLCRCGRKLGDREPAYIGKRAVCPFCYWEYAAGPW